MAEEWRGLTKKDKVPYENMAQKARSEFEIAYRAFTERNKGRKVKEEEEGKEKEGGGKVKEAVNKYAPTEEQKSDRAMISSLRGTKEGGIANERGFDNEGVMVVVDDKYLTEKRVTQTAPEFLTNKITNLKPLEEIKSDEDVQSLVYACIECKSRETGNDCMKVRDLWEDITNPCYPKEIEIKDRQHLTNILKVLVVKRKIAYSEETEEIILLT